MRPIKDSHAVDLVRDLSEYCKQKKIERCPKSCVFYKNRGCILKKVTSWKEVYEHAHVGWAKNVIKGIGNLSPWENQDWVLKAARRTIKDAKMRRTHEKH